MPLLIPEGFAAVELLLRHVSQTRQAEVTFGIELASVTGSNTELADQITTDYESTLGVRTDIGVLIGPTVLHIGQSGGEALTIEGTLTGGGARDTNVAPSNCAFLFKKVTARGGRRGRGRFYLPWIVADAGVDDVGAIDGGEAGPTEDAATDFLLALGDAGSPVGAHPMVLLHNSGGSTTPGDPDLVTALVGDRLIATQRRRIGRG
jgi:hypothetical protein